MRPPTCFMLETHSRDRSGTVLHASLRCGLSIARTMAPSHPVPRRSLAPPVGTKRPPYFRPSASVASISALLGSFSLVRWSLSLCRHWNEGTVRWDQGVSRPGPVCVETYRGYVRGRDSGISGSLSSLLGGSPDAMCLPSKPAAPDHTGLSCACLIGTVHVLPSNLSRSPISGGEP